MPKVTMLYAVDSNLTMTARITLRNKLIPQVAELVGDGITPDMIDWHAVGFGKDSKFDQPLAFEIETYDFEVRIANLSEERLEPLKAEIIRLTAVHLSLDPEKKLVWVKFVDQRGPHV